MGERHAACTFHISQPYSGDRYYRLEQAVREPSLELSSPLFQSDGRLRALFRGTRRGGAIPLLPEDNRRMDWAGAHRLERRMGPVPAIAACSELDIRIFIDRRRLRR